MPWDSMSAEDQNKAKEEWRRAEHTSVSDNVDTQKSNVEAEENADIDKAMSDFMRIHMKWAHKELHGALLAASVAVPHVPSMRNYFGALFAQYGNADTFFFCRNHSTPTQGSN